VLRDYPAAADAAQGDVTRSPPLSGAFGAKCVNITSLVASDPRRIDGSYGPSGDVISVKFNTLTNTPYIPSSNGSATGGYAVYSAGTSGVGRTLQKPAVDALFSFFCGGVPCGELFASNYTGTWTARDTFDISIVNASSVYPYNPTADPDMLPVLGQFSVAVNPGVDLRNYPPACLPNAPESPLLSGSFGPSNIYIVSVTIRDPTDWNDVYSDGDEITIRFSEQTDYAGLGAGPWSKEQIDGVFRFSRSLGSDYVGRCAHLCVCFMFTTC
jgi:hypothetical protein